MPYKQRYFNVKSDLVIFILKNVIVLVDRHRLLYDYSFCRERRDRASAFSHSLTHSLTHFSRSLIPPGHFVRALIPPAFSTRSLELHPMTCILRGTCIVWSKVFRVSCT